MNTQKLRDMNLHAVADELERLRAFKAVAEVQDGFREIVEAVAHIGVDFGYGNFALSQEHIEKARALLEAAPSHSQQGEEAGVSALVEALEEARLTLDVLQGRGSSVKLTLAIIDRALAAYRKGGDHCPSHESEQGGNDV